MLGPLRQPGSSTGCMHYSVTRTMSFANIAGSRSTFLKPRRLICGERTHTGSVLAHLPQRTSGIREQTAVPKNCRKGPAAYTSKPLFPRILHGRSPSPPTKQGSGFYIPVYRCAHAIARKSCHTHPGTPLTMHSDQARVVFTPRKQQLQLSSTIPQHR